MTEYPAFYGSRRKAMLYRDALVAAREKILPHIDALAEVARGMPPGAERDSLLEALAALRGVAAEVKET